MQKPIRIYTPYMDLLHETDNYISLQFMPKFYDIGEFELHINQYIEGAEFFQKNNLIMLDKRPDKVMFIKHREIALDESGKASENWKITGFTLDGVLNQRVTVPPNGQENDSISGDAETAMKHYIDRHFINPDDSKRKIPQMEIAENKHRGIKVKWDSRFKNVGDEIVAIAKQANLGWAVYADMVRKKWIFDVIEQRDLTQDNPAGYPPVFFSPDFSTIKSQNFVDSDLNYKNFGYVGGQGEGADRKIVTVGEGTGLDRIETFIDARDVGSSDDEPLTDAEVEQQLIQRGNEGMAEFSTDFYLEAQILTPSINDQVNQFAMTTPFEYEKDFKLGDVVQVFNKKWNITMDAPITEFKEIHENGFALEATFGEAQPTLIKKIKSEFDKINGVKQQELPSKISIAKMEEAKQYTDDGLSAEEQARIQQAQENLGVANSKSKTFITQPITPYQQGDIWKDGQQTKISTMTRTSGSYTDSDWVLTGDVTSQNTSADTAKVAGTPAEDVKTYAQWGKDIANSAEVSIGSDGISIKDGAFMLEDDQTPTKYNASPKRNLIKDHSFELLQSDQNNINADCGTYNWLESLPDNLVRDTPWRRVGSPKISMVFSTNVTNSLPIFGGQAAVISNANYYRQYVYDGIASNTKYTISAHFKRQWNVAVCGIPIIQIWHIHDNARVVQLVSAQFDAVKSDYSVSRHAVTITTPANFAQNDQLEVIVSGLDSNWIQCDGVQMTEGELAAIYEPEDSVWEITKGNYRPIKKQKKLWSGGSYPDDTQIVTPLLPLSGCQNGWILEWQKYTVGVGPSDIQFSHTYIPKEFTIHGGSASYSVDVPYNATTKLFKYLYIYDDHIVGHAQNKTDPNSSKVLTAIYEF